MVCGYGYDILHTSINKNIKKKKKKKKGYLPVFSKNIIS